MSTVNNEFDAVLDTRRRELETQMQSLELQISELKSQTVAIVNANSMLEQMLRAEKDKDKKMRIMNLIRYNYDIYVKLNLAIKEYEDVKFRYHKEIDDITISYNRLAVDIEKLRSKSSESMSQLLDLLRKVSDINLSSSSLTDLGDKYKI